MGSSGTRKVQALQAVLALLAALLEAGCALLILFGRLFGLFFWLDEPEAPLASVLGSAWPIAYTGVMLALPVVLTGALVFYVAFRRLGWFLAWQSAAGGAVLGALVAPAELIVTGDWEGLFSLELLGFGLLGALPGAVGGLVFWWIAARPLAPAKKHDGLPETAARQFRG